jgi:pSer/pThr/pTyr-binding forkhead associated (FHA) protein
VSDSEGRLVLEDHSRYGTFVNETRVEGTVPLAAGDRIRVGAPGLALEAIRVRSGA